MRGVQRFIISGIRTELVLANRFARIVNVDTCLSSL